jgi:hypothetical protein
VHEELFDLAGDSGEQRALAAEPERRAALARHLAAARLRAQRLAADGPGEAAPEADAADAMTEEERRQLEALGYL